MLISLYRFHKDSECTLGILSLFSDDHDKAIFSCNTLEPSIDNPIFAAIPAGSYICSLAYSPRFKQNVLYINDVPGRVGIEFHPGNYPYDTQGCILVGFLNGDDNIICSYKVFQAFMEICLNVGGTYNLTIFEE
jgi:hypothetical protein